MKSFLTARLLAPLLFVPLCFAPPGALGSDGPEPDYRLTGIIGSAAGGESLAVIETGDGEQQLVKVGDALGDARVERIDVDTMTVLLAQAGETRSLQLPAGDAATRVADSAPAAGRAASLRWEDVSGEVTMLGITNEEIKALQSLATKDRQGDAQAPWDGFSQLLGLDAGTRITALQEQSSGGGDMAPGQIAWDDWIAAPDGARLGVLATQTRSGPGRVYLEKKADD